LEELAAWPVAITVVADDAWTGGACSGGGGSEGPVADMKGLFRIDRGPDGSLPPALEDGGEAEYATG
jgi:hypothetical protein